MSVPEVVAFLAGTYGVRVSVRTVQNWTRRLDHPLPCIRYGNRIRIHRDHLTRWLARGAEGGALGGTERPDTTGDGG
jgi:hypothetical protein